MIAAPIVLYASLNFEWPVLYRTLINQKQKHVKHFQIFNILKARNIIYLHFRCTFEPQNQDSADVRNKIKGIFLSVTLEAKNDSYSTFYASA